VGGARVLLIVAAALAAVAFLFRRSRLPIARLFGWVAAGALALQIVLMLVLSAGDWVHGARSLDAGQLFSLAVFVVVVVAEIALVRCLLARR
jgi:hypothetical protein